MTKEELLSKTNHNLRMKDLRKFVEENKYLDDESPVVVERVEDSYFREHEWEGIKIKGWDVLKVEGYDYNSALCYNSTEPNKFGEKELEEMKEQFYQPHCITTYQKIIYIYSHH